MYHRLGIDKSLVELAEKIENSLSERFYAADKVAEKNQIKVILAFQNQRISETHFSGSTGYGYGDAGRDALDALFAEIMGARDALVRHQFVSGTHAIAVAMFGVLRPGKTILSVTGRPYDTLLEVIGLRGDKGSGSLLDFGVNYSEIPLTPQGKINIHRCIEMLDNPDVSVIYLQRSRGYTPRRAISVDEIAGLCSAVKSRRSDVVIMVDNCYGEFVQEKEPCEAGADLSVGSLIKNPGGGLADTGGYIAGRADLMELCAYRLTSPGIGRETGATLNQKLNMFRGAFLAPVVTSSAVKTAIFASALFQGLGYNVSPFPDEPRYDIIQMIELKSKDALLAFCKGIQSASAVDSHLSPEPWGMPGYDDEVIMAAGTFVQGASIELSADAPVREPYNVFLQGALTYPAGKIGVLMAAQELFNKRLLPGMQ